MKFCNQNSDFFVLQAQKIEQILGFQLIEPFALCVYNGHIMQKAFLVIMLNEN